MTNIHVYYIRWNKEQKKLTDIVLNYEKYLDDYVLAHVLDSSFDLVYLDNNLIDDGINYTKYFTGSYKTLLTDIFVELEKEFIFSYDHVDIDAWSNDSLLKSSKILPKKFFTYLLAQQFINKDQIDFYIKNNLIDIDQFASMLKIRCIYEISKKFYSSLLENKKNDLCRMSIEHTKDGFYKITFTLQNAENDKELENNLTIFNKKIAINSKIVFIDKLKFNLALSNEYSLNSLIDFCL